MRDALHERRAPRPPFFKGRPLPDSISPWPCIQTTAGGHGFCCSTQTAHANGRQHLFSRVRQTLSCHCPTTLADASLGKCAFLIAATGDASLGALHIGKKTSHAAFSKSSHSTTRTCHRTCFPEYLGNKLAAASRVRLALGQMSNIARDCLIEPAVASIATFGRRQPHSYSVCQSSRPCLCQATVASRGGSKEEGHPTSEGGDGGGWKERDREGERQGETERGKGKEGSEEGEGIEKGRKEGREGGREGKGIDEGIEAGKDGVRGTEGAGERAGEGIEGGGPEAPIGDKVEKPTLRHGVYFPAFSLGRRKNPTEPPTESYSRRGRSLDARDGKTPAHPPCLPIHRHVCCGEWGREDMGARLRVPALGNSCTKSHQPSGRRWLKELPLPSSLLPLRGGVYPSP